MKENVNTGIELRSEKVRSIIGRIPPRIERIGITVVSMVIGLALLLAYTIPYPQYKTVSVKLYSEREDPDALQSVFGIAYISKHSAKEIKIGQIVEFEIEDQLFEGCISQILPETGNFTKKSRYVIKIDFPEPVELFDLILTGKILMSNQPFLKSIL